MYDLSRDLTDTDHYLVVAKVKDNATVCKQAAQKLDEERSNLKKEIELEVEVELETNSKNNIRDFYRGITDIKKCYQPRINTVQDKKGV